MGKQISISVLAVLLLSAGACAPPEPVVEEEAAPQEAPAPDSAADEAFLHGTSEAWINAFNAGDGTAIAAMMTEDGMLMPPNAEPVEGREAIAAFWQGFIETGAQGTLEHQELILDGDTAVKLGTYELTNAEGEVFENGKWMETWTRVGGEWQLHRDIWNANHPTEAPTE